MSLGINSIDHFVLTVANCDNTLHFYGDILGMKIETFGDNRLAIRMGEQKINIHVAGREIAPHAASPLPGTGDFCLISSRPVEELVAVIEARGGIIELGPVARTGASCPLQSIYLRDPDGNLVEIANKVPQTK